MFIFRKVCLSTGGGLPVLDGGEYLTWAGSTYHQWGGDGGDEIPTLDRLRRRRCTSCGFPQEDFLVRPICSQKLHEGKKNYVRGGGARPLRRFSWIRHCVLLRSPFLSAVPAILTHNVTSDATLLSNDENNGHEPEVLRYWMFTPSLTIVGP